MLEFAIPIAPKGKERHRSMIRGGKIATYNTKKATAYEAEIREYVQSKYDGKPLEGPLIVHVVAIFKRPATVTRAQHTVKPDADNIAKAICDSLNGVLWSDDKSIVYLTIRKLYGDKDLICLEVHPL
jgi:Holliday junction resolvase RusA-like endonuclease